MHVQVVPHVLQQARLRLGVTVSLAEDTLLVLLPQGGQGGSRHNARLAVAAEAALAAARRESEEALSSASTRSHAAAV